MPSEVLLPLSNPNDAEAEIVRWLVADGEPVQAGEDVVEVETSKASVTVTSPQAGYLLRRAGEGDVVRVGVVLATVFEDREGLEAARAQLGLDGQAADAVGGRAPTATRFSDAAMEELQRLGLRPDLFAGRGLVTRRIVRDAGAGVPVRRWTPSHAKRLEIERLAAGRSALTSALTIEFDSATVRSRLLRSTPPQRLLLPTVLHHLARLLPDFPELNARYDEGQVACYEEVNVGVAIDLGRGLRVPVIRRADRLSPAEIMERLMELTARYEDRSLSVADMEGGTVTVSDLSGDGILQFQPLINRGQSSGFGVGGDAAAPGFPMTVTAVFDHRVTGGRQVADFLRELRGLLAAPLDP